MLCVIFLIVVANGCFSNFDRCIGPRHDFYLPSPVVVALARNVYYHGPPTTSEPKSPQCCTPAAPGIDIVAASAALDRSLGDVELATNMMTGHPDLSVILEQSQFMDAIPIPFTEDEPSEG